MNFISSKACMPAMMLLCACLVPYQHCSMQGKLHSTAFALPRMNKCSDSYPLVLLPAATSATVLYDVHLIAERKGASLETVMMCSLHVCWVQLQVLQDGCNLHVLCTDLWSGAANLGRGILRHNAADCTKTANSSMLELSAAAAAGTAGTATASSCRTPSSREGHSSGPKGFPLLILRVLLVLLQVAGAAESVDRLVASLDRALDAGTVADDFSKFQQLGRISASNSKSRR